MKLVVYIVLEFMFENSLAAPTDTFGCYGDLCEVGVEYCAEDSRHCVPCSQTQDACGTVSILSDCHLYCLNLTEQEPSTVHTTISVTGVPTRPHAATCQRLTQHAVEEQSQEPTLLVLAAVFGVMLVINLSLFFGGLVIHYLKNGPCKQAMIYHL
ncbi:uncharacterized protein LOC124268655 isoform X3 [Haliotis rubra]|uniref:uncharacterized protein LOC124268655 isoform X3 n=1 Tax=Haliotis rubra TaxID=36100 RepID=UPI001EE60915|nr:uncharacterized protein LOC124268655 isoform X3 [Haliotis rubra]